MNSGLALGYEVQSFVAAPFHMTKALFAGNCIMEEHGA